MYFSGRASRGPATSAESGRDEEEIETLERERGSARNVNPKWEESIRTLGYIEPYRSSAVAGERGTGGQPSTCTFGRGRSWSVDNSFLCG